MSHQQMTRKVLALVAILAVSAWAGACFADEAKLVNINTAASTELQTLPGIGPSKAQAIIDYRTEKGDFEKVDDLINVKGIGPKTMEKIKPLCTVGKPKPKE